MAVVLLLVATTFSFSAGAQPGVACDSRQSSAVPLRIVVSGELQHPELFASVCDWFVEGRWQVRFEHAVWRPSPLSTRQMRKLNYPRTRLPAVLLVQRAANGAILLEYQRWGVAALAFSKHRVNVEWPLDAMAIEELAQSIHGIVQLQDERWKARYVDGLTSPSPGSHSPGSDSSDSGAKPLYPLTVPSAPVASSDGPVLALAYRAIERGDEPSSSGVVANIELPWTLVLPSTNAPSADAWQHALLLSVGGFRSAGKLVERSLELTLAGSSYALGLATRRRWAFWSWRGTAQLAAERTVARMQQITNNSILSPIPRGISWRGFVEVTSGVSLPVQAFEVRFIALLRAQLNASPYQVQEEDTLRELFAPSPWQPGVQVQLAYAWR